MTAGHNSAHRARAGAEALQNTQRINASTWAALVSAHGWQPIALRPNEKRPILAGWQAATLEETTGALNSTPAANLGIAVPTGFLVLDVDRKNGNDGFASLRDAGIALPDTLNAATPSGGRHYWFKLPPGLDVRNAVAIAPGLDVRAAGGFVAAAPSRIDGKGYAWQGWDGSTEPNVAAVPAELLELIQRPRKPAPTPIAGQSDEIPEGQRNATMARIAGRLRAEGMDADEMVEILARINERRCSPPLDDSELARIAASVARYPAPAEAWQVGFGVGVELPAGATPCRPPDGLDAPAISEHELNAAHATPDCVVPNMFYADVAALIAPGAVGKTTLMVHTSACIALGRDVFGESVRKPGRVLILTAEDSRQILVARLRACMAAMELTDSERATVLDGVRIADVSGLGFKLTEVVGDVVRPAPNVDALIARHREIQPVLIVIDPAVSFGVGEARINDAEQGLIEAARAIRNALNCCVLYVHHSGKANARERTLDQYSGRGGSAFADGSRMVLVMQPVDANEWQAATGQILEPGETGLILARPKMSYCPPPGDIYIKRRGYRFERVEFATHSKAAQLEASAAKVWQLLSDELSKGRYHSKNSIEAISGMKRGELRNALSWLEVSGRIETRDRPGNIQRGARDYLHPVASPGPVGEASGELPKKEAIASPTENPFLASPSLREIKSGEASRAFGSPVSLGSPKSLGEATANRGEPRT